MLIAICHVVPASLETLKGGGESAMEALHDIITVPNRALQEWSPLMPDEYQALGSMSV